VYSGDKFSDANRDGANETPPLSLAPSLFAAAQQTPRTVANITLTGLLALSDSTDIVVTDKFRLCLRP
jgi:hypothetical protein